MQHLITRVLTSDAALELIRTLRQKHGPLILFQAGSSCGSSALMCHPAYDLSIDETDIYLGNLDGVPVYIGSQQYEYWKHTQLIVDVAEGNCGIFSLENETGKHFLARSHLFSDEENTV